MLETLGWLCCAGGSLCTIVSLIRAGKTGSPDSDEATQDPVNRTLVIVGLPLGLLGLWLVFGQPGKQKQGTMHETRVIEQGERDKTPVGIPKHTEGSQTPSK